ncbi:sugar transporter STL1 [Punctularia strigosozonata HHB-11173 SS5]|uniref:sugar transporter STL1 n=1 Tax=Punctularia strigosozonata (strain HHB-11173) TaxID=741275 RepID=UPI000441758A|nr:sugar transporter STL1 [Punctularia strigosozonata HHB-11173 SS5]EIN08312.1 sugar transporter STL1 [Punctularia strigosozonata HHB-11173 SS5]
MIGFAAGSGFLLFGYDQGVMGALLTLPSFVEVFPQINTNRNAEASSGTSHESTLQGVAIGLYEIGCLIGALSCLWLGDLLGRRAIIWIGTFWMIAGAIIQASSFSLGQLIAGRIVCGIGNGMHTATIPMWQSECSPPHKRGMLVMIEGLLITGGICMAYWIDFAFFWLDPVSQHTTFELNDFPHRSASWRVPIAFQILLCIPTFITIWMPESPRWLMLKGREEEARRVMASLDELPLDDPEIDLKIQEIRESLALAQGIGVIDLFRQGKEKNFHRMALGFVNQMFQQISGINLITYYAATIYENNIGMSPLVSRIVAACNGTEYFLASFIAIWTIERFGRRKLMLFGAAGQSMCMVILAVCTSPAALKPEGGDPRNPATHHGPAFAAAVFLFIFNTFFAVGWLGMTWLYPAEITPLSIRAAANGVSTAANWIFNFVIVLITPIAFATIFNKTYIIFAVINAAMFVSSYYIFPETAGRSLEEMSAIFEHASVWNPYDVVRIEKRTPRRYDTKGRLLGRNERLDEEESADRSDEVQEKSGSIKHLEQSHRSGVNASDESTPNI